MTLLISSKKVFFLSNYNATVLEKTKTMIEKGKQDDHYYVRWRGKTRQNLAKVTISFLVCNKSLWNSLSHCRYLYLAFK